MLAISLALNLMPLIMRIAGNLLPLPILNLLHYGRTVFLMKLSDSACLWCKNLYGFLTFKNEIESGKILALYIDPLYMRLGIGKLLLQTAEQMVRMKGGSSIEVDVEVLNKGAISFYTSLQFAKVSVKLDHLIVMRKEFYNA